MLLSKNPEFSRQLWSQSSWLHLATLFVIPFLLVSFFVWEEGFRDLQEMAMWFALVWTMLILGMIGCLRVAMSMAGEVHAGTWDAQCMSGIEAGSFVIGKMFGSTIWFWISSLFAFAIAAGIGDTDSFTVTSQGDDPWQEKLVIPPLIFAICIISHLATIASATAMAGGARPGQRGYGLAGAFIGWIVAIMLLIIIAPFPEFVWKQHVYSTDPWPFLNAGNADYEIRRIIERGPFWFSVSTHSLHFKTLVLGMALFFSAVAAWRLMRREFRHIESPLAAPAFMLTFMTFGLGVIPVLSKGSMNGAEAFFTSWYYSLLILYGMLLIERRDPIRMMRVARQLYGTDGGRRRDLIPGWLWALGIFSIFSLLLYPALISGTINAMVSPGSRYYIGQSSIFFGIVLPVVVVIMRFFRDAFVLGIAATRKNRGSQGMDWIGPAAIVALGVLEFILASIIFSNLSPYRMFRTATSFMSWSTGMAAAAMVYYGVWLITLGLIYRNRMKDMLASIKAPARTISAEKP